MERPNITVTMPVEEYNRLKNIEDAFKNYVRMFERANPDGGSAIFTDELQQTIKEIYC